MPPDLQSEKALAMVTESSELLLATTQVLVAASTEEAKTNEAINERPKERNWTICCCI